MTATLNKQPETLVQDPRGLCERASEMVLRELGTPKNLYRVDCKEVWQNHFRVNVYCTVETGIRLDKVLITDSFFLSFGDQGFKASPAIEKKY